MEAYFSDIETTPIIEGDGIVHFVWRGDAEDVGLSGDPIPEGDELGLHRVEGTNLFFRSLELDPESHVHVQLHPQLW